MFKSDIQTLLIYNLYNYANAFASSTNCAIPLSVNGCLNICINVAGGTVATSAPIKLDYNICIGLLTDATKILVSKP